MKFLQITENNLEPLKNATSRWMLDKYLNNGLGGKYFCGKYCSKDRGHRD